MQIRVKSSFVRRLLIFVQLGAFLGLVIWIAKTYVAYVLAREPVAGRLALAIRLDPANAEYHLGLGRLFQYGVSDVQPEKAQDQFQRSAQLSPRDPRPLLELGASLALQGKTSEAASCLLQADFLAPNLPNVQWSVANFFLLQGNVDEAFRHFRVVLSGTAKYDQIIFSTAWKASSDADKILQQLIPRNLPTEFNYLYFLVNQDRYAEAQSVWKRIIGTGERFPPQRVADYVLRLINTRQPDEAYAVWTDLQANGIVPNPIGTPHGNLISNPGFEDEPVNMGFAWHIEPLESVYAGLDTSTYRSPSHSLLIQFLGKQNLSYGGAFQYVKVSPGSSYRLQAFVKTEGITTDTGPQLEVNDAYDASALHVFSENFIGTTTGWEPILLTFKTGSKTKLIVVRIRRFPSRKFDNLIAGKFWLDDVQLTPLP